MSRASLPDGRAAARVPPAEYTRLLGYPPGTGPDGAAARVAEEARAWYEAWGTPWIHLRDVGIAGTEGERLLLEDGTALRSPSLADRVGTSGAHALAVCAVSAGPEVDDRVRALWAQGRPDEAWALDAFGSAVAEALVVEAGAKLCARVEPGGTTVLPYTSPGYDGWDLREQRLLFRILRPSREAALPGPLALLPSAQLVPRKSFLTVFPITRRRDIVRRMPDLVPCTLCAFHPCAYRRAPYLVPPARIPLPPVVEPERKVPVDYAFPRKALARWARDLLDLKIRPDGTVAARFRFDGKTCSNGGIPLVFDYEVLLTHSPRGYRIVSTACRPAEGDAGHRRTCAYVSNPYGFLATLGEKHPMRGRLVDEILAWEPATNPAGCLCTPENRNHKWRIVLQTIHYALRARTCVT